MDITTYYAIAFSGSLALYPLYLITYPIARSAFAWARLFFVRSIRYRLLPRGCNVNITWLELIAILLYIGGNIVGLSLGNLAGLQRRAGILALINATPLYLGGQTNPLADWLRVPLSTYYLTHGWVGAVAVFEALLHTALALSAGVEDGHLLISGHTSAWTLLASALMAPRFVRRHLDRLFSRVHLPLALGALGGLSWHVSKRAPSWIPTIVSSSIWVSTTIYNIFKFIHGADASVDSERGDTEVTVVRLRTTRPFRVFPGGYFYILRPDSVSSLFSSRAMIAAWYTPGRLLADGKITGVTLLVSNRSLHHPIWLQKGQYVRLLGPYGRDLGLPEFETVIFTAKGIGIAGVLPLALDLAERRLHDNRVRGQYRVNNQDDSSKEGGKGSSRATSFDSKRSNPGSLDSEKRIGNRLVKRQAGQGSRLFRDATRKVDLFWELEHNRQDKWLLGELLALKPLDPDNKLLVVWLLYPSPLVGEPPFKNSPYWKCVYPSKTSTRSSQSHIQREILSESRSPGKSAVVACGDPDFTATIRNTVVSYTTVNRVIHFFESDFKPRANKRWEQERGNGYPDLESQLDKMKGA